MKQQLVFDTNVLISGYLWDGKPRQAIQLVKSGNFRLIYCRESLEELIRVLNTKFGLAEKEIYEIVIDLQTFGKNINISSKEYPITNDLSDNLFINLAIDGDAKIIVSGDSHLLKLNVFKDIAIFSVSEFLKQNL